MLVIVYNRRLPGECPGKSGRDEQYCAETRSHTDVPSVLRIHEWRQLTVGRKLRGPRCRGQARLPVRVSFTALLERFGGGEQGPQP